jgi:hypothetical protein
MRASAPIIIFALVCLPLAVAAQVNPPGACQGKACGVKTQAPLTGPDGVAGTADDNVQAEIEDIRNDMEGLGGGGGGGGATSEAGLELDLLDATNVLTEQDFGPTVDQAPVSTGDNTFTFQTILKPASVATAALINALITSGNKVVTVLAGDSGTASSTTTSTLGVKGGSGIDVNCSGADCFVSLEVAGSALSEAEKFQLCRTGLVAGGGYRTDTDTYDWTCGNYNWSGEKGGTIVAGSGRVASFGTATTAGGNGYTIECSGDGTGIGQDGSSLNDATDLRLGSGTVTASSTTTVVNDSDVTYGVNALAGYIIKFDAATTTVALRNDERYIASNTATAITVGKAFSDAPATGDVYHVYNPAAGACWANGETVRLNYMADAMLAQEMTRDGGEVLFPIFPDKAAGIYVATGCGRQTHVGAASQSDDTPTLNACPVLRGANDGHYQRVVNAGVRNIRWVGEQADWDLFDEDGAGREGVYFVDDTGGWLDQTTMYDPNGDGHSLATYHAQQIGTFSEVPNECVPISNSDPRCDVTQGAYQSYLGTKDARSFTSGTYSDDATTEGANSMCLNDVVNAIGNPGVCVDDPRIECTVAGTGGARASGGCDFGAGGTSTHLGVNAVCASFVDALEVWAESDPDKAQQWLVFSRTIPKFPSSTHAQSDEALAPLQLVEGTACGSSVAGEEIRLGHGQNDAWPMWAGEMPVSASTTVGWVSDDYITPKGGISGVTFIPNDYFTSPACQSGGVSGTADYDGADDEARCDAKGLIIPGFVYGGGIYDSVLAYGSITVGGEGTTPIGSYFDGYVGQQDFKVMDSLITKGRRGALGDWSRWHVENVRVANNLVPQGGLLINSCFASGGYLKNVELDNNQAYLGLGVGNGVGCRYHDVVFRGNSFAGGTVAFSGGVGVSFRGTRFIGGSLPGFVFDTDWGATLANIEITDTYATGSPPNGAVSGVQALALFDFMEGTSSGGTGLGHFRNINISGAHLVSWRTNAVLASLVEHATASRNVNVDRAQVSIRDSSIDCVDGATGCKAIIVSDYDDLGVIHSGDDDGIQTKRYQPVIDNVKTDGVAITNRLHPTIAAASAPTCAADYFGTVVAIHDDTGAGLCADSAGVLTGGSTFRSTCRCTPASSWDPN